MPNKKLNPNLIRLVELTHNPNLKIDENILEETSEKPTKPIQPQSIQAPSNINPKDYLQVPNTNTIISKFELPGYNDLDYEDTHIKLLENRLFMPSPAIFLPHFLNIIEAYKGNTMLYDASGNKINTQETQDIYKHLTTNHIAAYQGQQPGAWTWLNAKFKKQNNNWIIEIVESIDNNKQLITKTSPLEQCLMKNRYVDLNLSNFNSQGFPIKSSNQQDYVQGENIYYFSPREDAVAWFDAVSGRAGFYCSGNPSVSYASLGVFGCCEAARAKI